MKQSESMGNIFVCFKQLKMHHLKWIHLQPTFLGCVLLKGRLKTIFVCFVKNNNFQNNF